MGRKCPYLSPGTWDLKSVEPFGYSCSLKMIAPDGLAQNLSDTSISSSLSLNWVSMTVQYSMKQNQERFLMSHPADEKFKYRVELSTLI